MPKQRFNGYAMKIKLTSDRPVYSNPRRLSYGEKVEVQKTVDELLRQGIIQQSDSPYASPIVLVRKKSGELRMCVDYRALNKLTIRDHFPLPIIEDCLEYLGGKKYFSTLDLKSGFHQVPMHEESIPLTAFVTPMGQYEYCYMPFGLTNAPPVFQRYIGQILRTLIDTRQITVYMDDISVATETLEEHKDILEKLLKLLSGAGLRLNFEKCKFAYRELDYLGYHVNANGIRPNDTHLSAIRDFAIPTDVRSVQRCIGLFQYFRKFVPGFSTISLPLRKLTMKNVSFEWNEDCMRAFNELKRRLTEAPILCVYNPKLETELHTDASSRGFGAVLLQKQVDAKFHPVAYFSKSTTPEEVKYHSFELETLAIVYALKRFRMFLEGIRFVIVTDCNSLALTLNKKQINPRIARWTLEFENYDYTVRHRKGEQMAHADALSRQQFVCLVDGSDLDLNIQISQSRDERIRELRERLEQENVSGYKLENGLVFRINKDGRAQLYVPAEWEENIMRKIHESYGHVGIEKCLNQILKHYWFPGIREKLNKFIRNCLKCIYYSSAPRAGERNLYSLNKIPEPFHTVHIDHFGPLPALRSKRKHVLVVVDAFTKFTKLYAVNGTSTKESWCALKKYFEVYSRPTRIISDRGTCFTSEEFARNMRESNIKHVLVSVASPQSNGQVERANRVIKAMLAKLTDPMDHGDWVRQLTRVELSINNTVHSTTKQTPSKCLFGVEQKGENIDELTEYLHESYPNVQRSLSEIRAEALKSIQRSQQYNQQYFEERHRPARLFKEGDLVVIKHVDTAVGSNKKLIIKYRGPYVIYKQLGHDRYRVTDVENCQLTQMPYDNVIDSSRIKLWLEHTQREGGSDDTVGDTAEEVDECTDYEYLDEEFEFNE